jgi:hypothetical protein
MSYSTITEPVKGLKTMGDTELLLNMLSYKRPEGTMTQRIFCERFLQPVMGQPDRDGNYVHVVYNDDGSAPNLCFTAHHDTVHRTEGLQKVLYDPHLDLAYVDHGECLGADCTTGIFLILRMIEAKVPAIYVVHAGEEIGCIGSSALVNNMPSWLFKTDAVISFDRYGTKSVITHQMGRRTASESFAESFAEALGMDTLLPDPDGSYTDSNEYVEVVGECTNISIGYYSQHTKNEYQDIEYAIDLKDALITADWSKLRFERLAGSIEYDGFYGGYTGRGWTSTNRPAEDNTASHESISELIYDNPEGVAMLLESWGFSVSDLEDGIEELDAYYGSTY